MEIGCLGGCNGAALCGFHAALRNARVVSVVVVAFLFFGPMAAQHPKAKKQLNAAFTAFNRAEFSDALGLTKKPSRLIRLMPMRILSKRRFMRLC